MIVSVLCLSHVLSLCQQAFVGVPDSERKQWCKSLALNHRSLHKAVHIHNQLAALMDSRQQPLPSAAQAGHAARQEDKMHGEDHEPDEALRRALVSGLFSHAALLQPDGKYASILSGRCYLSC